MVATKTDGTLWAWGFNTRGAVGDGTVISRSSPVQVGSLTNWTTASISGFGNCAAIKTDGTLWAWGYNAQGQLGQNSLGNLSSPVQVGALTTWGKVSSGYVVAAIKTDGTLWAWGFNSSGSVGDGTVINRSSPVQVGSLTDWSLVSSTSGSVTATKKDGTLWAWGGNGVGQLGTNNVVSRSSPVQVGSLTKWSQVSGRAAIYNG
jgi:alpha-tubulin suppressor-like RCC1 family protein